MESFAPWIERLEKQLNERVWNLLIDEIPSEWYGDDRDALYRLAEELHRRRPRVPDLRILARRCALTASSCFGRGLWDRIQQRVPVSEFTFPGDPMRMDYAYRRNGTHGFVHTLPVRRAPELTKNLAYTADRISSKAPWKSEFAAVTDVALSDGIPLQRFVRDALR